METETTRATVYLESPLHHALRLNPAQHVGHRQ